MPLTLCWNDNLLSVFAIRVMVTCPGSYLGLQTKVSNLTAKSRPDSQASASLDVLCVSSSEKKMMFIDWCDLATVQLVVVLTLESFTLQCEYNQIKLML